MGTAGVVVIGRNEGERLRACLQSIDASAQPVVYVDSGSTDGSQELAAALGAAVVALDLTTPFTAARARNAGFENLTTNVRDIEFVQFIDGDCVLDRSWLPVASAVGDIEFVHSVDGDCVLDRSWLLVASAALAADAKIAVVCGRRREIAPTASIYNRLCDLEWDTPVGETEACGGDALMRVQALRAAGGYRDNLIAGEEPELCVRLRAHGGRIVRLPEEMTRHDAGMTRFSQWWARNVRAGYAFAEVSRLHAGSPFGIWRRQTRSNWFWGLIVPVLAIAPAYVSSGISLLLLGSYLVLFVRIARRRRQRGTSRGVAHLFAAFCVLSKFPQMLGQLRFHVNRLLGRRQRLIEYKSPRTNG